MNFGMMDFDMMTLPKNLYTAAQVRELDRIVIEKFHTASSTLMARAADAVFRQIIKKWPKAKKIAVVCGVGNNAGDGLLVAKLTIKHKKNVEVFLLNKKQIPKNFNGFDLIVDAILGTGLSRAVSGNFKTAIEKINASGKPVISIDIPSGLNADTGMPWGIAVKANITVTFIGLKQGLFTGEGPEYSGKVFFSDLKVPKMIYEKISAGVERLELSELKKLLPKRARGAHKGKNGHTLIVGGNHGMAGAVQLACESALRVGSGLVSLATETEHANLITALQPEIMSSGVKNAHDLKLKIAKATVIGVGPGLGQTKWSQDLWNTCLKSKLPLVVDADALNLLALKPCKKANWILTPHVGEAARLLGVKNSGINNDRFTAIKNLQKKYGGAVVLKGCGTLVYGGGDKIFLCDLGNPGMASGGMGDTLTGIISGLIAQGLSLLGAAKLGVCLHARAGDIAAQNGERGLIASDLIQALKKMVN